jgi:glycosyltransferase involved in cell wall biosynthesis
VSIPAFSVVIPLYNKEPHIARAIRSVLNQTYGSFELVIGVDGGTTDGSAKVAETFNDPRIRRIYHEHTGISAARNLCIAESRADLIAFLDADDEWLPDYLETIMALVNRFPVAGAWSTTYYRTSRDGIQAEWQGNVSILEGDCNAGIINIFARNARRPFYTSSIVIRKGTLVSIGAFPVGVPRGEDVDTWFRLAFRFPIAWCYKSKVIYHRNVVNPTDVENCLWSGVPPYFGSLQRFIEEKGGQRSVSIEAVDHIMRRHSGAFHQNLLAGNRKALLRIARDFESTKGYRLRGLAFHIASLIPHRAVMGLRLMWRFIRGRTLHLPETRVLYLERGADLPPGDKNGDKSVYHGRVSQK